MADLSRLKRRRNTLGAPPPLEEASHNLAAPETAPVAAHVASVRPVVTAQTEGRQRSDGRSMRRTGRTLQFATRVSMDWDDKLRMIAERDGLKFVEVLERGLDAYEVLKRQEGR